jgi:type I restriction enzyme S subunit
MKDWKEYKLGDIAEIISERTNINNASLENYISTENMINDFGGVRIAEKLPTSNSINQFQKNDILFSNIRTYFKKVWYSSFSGTVSPDVIVFRAKNCHSLFLYYQLCNSEFTEYTVLTSKGAKMPRGDKDAIRSFNILLPPLPEQTAIASILSSLDDKIDLLHRQNKTLEKMAEALFRQWFVEEAEADWEEGKLGDEFDFTMGQSPPGNTFNEELIGTPMYQGNADFGFRFPTNRIFTTEPKRFAEKYDTLISVRAPVGDQNMANENVALVEV